METFKRAIKSWINANTTACVRSLKPSLSSNPPLNDVQLSRREDVSSNTLVSGSISNSQDDDKYNKSAGTNSGDEIDQGNAATVNVAPPTTAASVTTTSAQQATNITLGSTLSTASAIPDATASASAQVNTAPVAMSRAHATAGTEPSG